MEWEVDQIENLGVEISTNTTVGEDVSVDDILNNFDRSCTGGWYGKCTGFRH